MSVFSRFRLPGINLMIMTLFVPTLTVSPSDGSNLCLGQEFRIETEVMRLGESIPISSNLTLFEGGLIYDFLLSDTDERFADEIAIFDTRQRQFILLNVSRQVKCIVPEYQLLRLMTAIRSQGVVKDEFLVNPILEEEFDASSGWLKLTSDRLTYRTRGHRPQDGAVLPLYYEFIDQFARLNATDPRRMPPFARLKLNSAIKKYGFIPEEIQMRLNVADGERTTAVELVSKHFVIWRLSEQDQQHIATAKRHWMNFREVDLKDYRDLEEWDVGQGTDRGDRSERQASRDE